MALGRRKRCPAPGDLFVTSADLPRSKGHPFYGKLDALLEGAKFDDFVEELVRPSYAEFFEAGEGVARRFSALRRVGCPRSVCGDGTGIRVRLE